MLFVPEYTELLSFASSNNIVHVPRQLLNIRFIVLPFYNHFIVDFLKKYDIIRVEIGNIYLK